MFSKPLPIVMLVLCGLLPAAVARAADKVDVLLKGHDQAITGYLREISRSRYILQGADQFYEFDADQLVSVNGDATPTDEHLGQGRLVYTTLYEKVLPTGDVEVWSNLDVDNSGSTLIDAVDWGAAAWEKEQTQNLEVRDQFGNQLPVALKARDDGGYRVSVALPVPVAPMESVSLSLKILRKGAAKHQGAGAWTYTFNVDFNEDRFFVRKIELPAGAQVTAPAGWWRHDTDGRIFLHSYFYYPAHTRVPQVISYRLSG